LQEEKDLKFLGKYFHKDNLAVAWNYIFSIEITDEQEKQIKFNDGEVQSVEWGSFEEIEKKIAEGEKITQDSIGVFNRYLNCKYFF
jgi:hypothetical protein